MSDDAVLEVEHVSRHFGGVKAVCDVSLKVQRGRIESLIGPNGAGKTTLFNTITGVLPVSSGEIHCTFRDGGRLKLSGLRPDQITRMGIARTFQNIRLFRGLTVLDNVKIGLHSRTRSGLPGAILRLPWTRLEERSVTSAALEYLAFVGLEGRAPELAGAMAYGDQRRLEIARALASHPHLLLLDEPAAGLNPTETRNLMELIQNIREAGLTIFLIEHDMRLVMEVSDHVYVLDHGVLICEGGPQAVQCDARVIEAYLGKGAAHASA